MKSKWIFPAAALAVSLLLAVFVSPYASKSPDGLERVAMDQGFYEKGNGKNTLPPSPMPGYKAGGVKNQKTAKGLAGLIGTLVIFGIAFGLGKVLSGRKRGERGGKEAG